MAELPRPECLIPELFQRLDIACEQIKTTTGEICTSYTWNTSATAREFIALYKKILKPYIDDGANRENPAEYEDDNSEDYAYFTHGFSVVSSQSIWSSRLSHVHKPRQLENLTDTYVVDTNRSHVVQIRTPGGNFMYAHEQGLGSWVTIESTNSFSELAAWMIRMQEGLSEQQEYELSQVLQQQVHGRV
jgi:hypothetical protein